MWNLPQYIGEPIGSALKAQLRVPEERNNSAEGIMTSYQAFLNHSWRTYGTKNIFAEAKPALRSFFQLPHRSSSDYSYAVCTNALHMGTVYDERQIKSLLSKE